MAWPYPCARASSDSTFPELVWTGGGYVVIWADDEGSSGNFDLTFDRISADGAVTGSAVIIADQSNSTTLPRASYNGTDLGVVRQEDRPGSNVVWFGMFDGVGEAASVEVELSSRDMPMNPSIVWTGSEWGVTYSGRFPLNDEIMISRVGPGGSMIGSEQRLTVDGAYSLVPSISWTGSEYGILFSDNRNGIGTVLDLFFIRVQGGGTKITSDINLSELSDPYINGGPVLVWSGSDFGYSWSGDDGISFKHYFNTVESCQ